MRGPLSLQIPVLNLTRDIYHEEQQSVSQSAITSARESLDYQY